jgi:hypothetical protein
MTKGVPSLFFSMVPVGEVGFVEVETVVMFKGTVVEVGRTFAGGGGGAVVLTAGGAEVLFAGGMGVGLGATVFVGGATIVPFVGV